MSVGSVVEVTCGCVSVCTKSVFGAAVVVGAVVVVMVGIGGAVDSVAVGTTSGFFLVRHAGASTAARIAKLKANDFATLFIDPPSFRSYQVGRWPLAVGRAVLELPTANCQPSRRLLRPVGILVLCIEGQLHEVGAVDAHPVDLPHAGAIRL